MTLYTKNKINEVTNIIKQISDRQKDIRKKIKEINNRGVKNILNIERTANSAAIRICYWIKWTLEGKPLKYKLSIDKEFPRWMHIVRGYYIQEFLAGVFNIPEDIYKFSPPSYRYIGFNGYRYHSQRNMYGMIIDFLFKKDGGGIFSFKNDDDIECDIWKEYFNKLIQKEWEEFKEMGFY